MPFSTRSLSISVVTLCTAMTALSLPILAQTASKDTNPAVVKGAASLAASPAMRIYDGTVVDCFKEVTNVDPVEAARTKNMQALNMDIKMITRIQECMTKKGVPANFDTYYTGQSKDDPVAGRRKDIQTIQSALDGGKASPAISAPAATPVPQPVAPKPQTVAPPPAAMPVPEPEKPKVDPAEGGGSTNAPRPSRQYWVKPE